MVIAAATNDSVSIFFMSRTPRRPKGLHYIR